MAQTKLSMKVTELLSDSECILKARPTVFLEKLDVVREREETKMITRFLTRIVKLQLPSTEIGKTVTRAIQKVEGYGETRSSILDRSSSRCPLKWKGLVGNWI